jgi:hypothetical protein
MDLVHGLRLMSLRASLNAGHRLTDQGPRLARWRGTMASNLERRLASGRLGATPSRGQCSGRRRNRPAVVAHRSWPYTVLQTLVFYEVFTYGIGTTWRTYFVHIGRTSVNNGGWWGRGGSAQARRRWRRAPGLLRLNRGHQRGCRPPVKLLGWSIWHGRWHTGVAASFTRWLGFRLLRIKIHRRTSTIYRAFCTES